MLKIPIVSALFSALIFSLTLPVSSENILVYEIIGSHSSRISIWPLVETLSDKGHNITFISPFDIEHPTIHSYAPQKWQKVMGSWDDQIPGFALRKSRQLLKAWFEFPRMGIQACEVLYSDPEFMSWVKSSKFDLIIMETSLNECGYGMAYLWNAKLIMFSTTTMIPWYNDAHGLPDETSSITDLMLNFPPGNEMAFWQRVVNAYNPIVWTLLREYWYFPALERISRNALGISELPKFSEIEKNVSLVMLTTHYSIEYPRSLPPHVIEVAGLVVSDKRTPLSKNFEDFINTGGNGFILISFGTIAEFTSFDESIQTEFVSALKKFPEMRFIWKSTQTLGIPLPDNVLLTPWAPQQSLLAHSKIKAFITHSGKGSIVEATHFGVPLICFPVLFEQDVNARSITARGAGITLEITTLHRSELELAIFDILHNPKYREAVTKLSEVFKDRQQTSLESAVWWTEFILRHNDTSFLRPLNVHQTWWKRRQLDVWVATFTAVIVCFYAVSRLVVAVLKVVSVIISFKDNKKAKRD